MIAFWNALKISNQVESNVHFFQFFMYGWQQMTCLNEFDIKRNIFGANNVTSNQWCINKQLILIYQCFSAVDFVIIYMQVCYTYSKNTRPKSAILDLSFVPLDTFWSFLAFPLAIKKNWLYNLMRIREDARTRTTSS